MQCTRPWQALGVWLLVSVLVGLVAPATWAQSPRQETLQSSAAATGNGTQASTLGYSLAAVQIVGTGFTGTLTFEASVDGATYTAVMCTSMADTATTSTTATGDGTWFCPIAGAQKFRARLSSYSAGAVTVKATLMPQVSRPPPAASTGGGGTVTSITGGTCLSGGTISSSGTLSVTADCIGPTQIDETANYTWSGTDRFTGTFSVPHSTSLPGTCTVGDAYMDTDATSGARWYLCESSNTWIAQGGTSVSGANPTGTIGLSAVNGSASTYLRSDGAPPLSQAIAPTWTGVHTFQGASRLLVNTSTSTDDQIALTVTAGGAARFTGTLTNADLTANRTYTLPNETGTLCTTGSVCSGYQPAGSYLTGVAIGDTITSGTAGSVLYLGTSGVLAQDNAGFSYTTTGGLLLADRSGVSRGILQIGDTPGGGTSGGNMLAINVDGNNADNNHIALRGYNDFVELDFSYANGTLASPTNVTSGKTLGDIVFGGYNSDVGGPLSGAEIIVKADSAFVADPFSAPSHFAFYTSAVERLRITSAGTTGVDATACTSNGSTHCLAGQVEVQSERLLLGIAGAPTTFGAVSYSGLIHTANSSNRASWTKVQSGNVGPEINFFTSGGTIASPTASGNGDLPFLVTGYAHDGTTWRDIGALQIGIASAVGTNSIGTQVALFSRSTADSGVVKVAIWDENLHYVTAGTVPTVAGTTSNACGTSAPSLTGTDMAGKVTVGATAGTSCKITFAKTWSAAPACTVTNETTANLLRATSTTTTVILAGTMVASDVLSYSCVGY